VYAEYADKKSWVANVARNPNVRLKIKGKVYEQKLVPITDPTTTRSVPKIARAEMSAIAVA